ncbi:hypothetical protein GQR58_027933 [Nymphon striatum]|nr:hypothetical protein GQR58_027933 [Nymphon striatum]
MTYLPRGGAGCGLERQLVGENRKAFSTTLLLRDIRLARGRTTGRAHWSYTLRFNFESKKRSSLLRQTLSLIVQTIKRQKLEHFLSYVKCLSCNDVCINCKVKNTEQSTEQNKSLNQNGNKD